MFGIGQWEILVIFLVVLLFFGAKRLPEMAQGLGKGIREFRKAVRDVQDEIDVTKEAAPASEAIDASAPPRQRAMPATAVDPAQLKNAEESTSTAAPVDPAQKNAGESTDSSQNVS